MTLGKYLRNRREELGLTQEVVAAYVDVPKGTISKWENDKVSEITRSNIKKLSEILKIDPITIVCWDDDNDISNPIKTNSYNGTNPSKKEISNLLSDILKRTDDVTKLDLLKKVLISFVD